MEQEKKEEKDIYEESFNALMDHHAKRIQDFMKNNPGKPLPIFREKDGGAMWLNREQRRKMNKNAKRR